MRWLVIPCLLAALGTARADDKAKAKQLYDEGLRHYNVAEYTDAIAAWKEAYLLSKKPLLLFNIGQAYRLSGDCTHALLFYDNYAREQGDVPNQDELDQAVAACKTAPAATTPATPPPATTTAPPAPPAPTATPPATTSAPTTQVTTTPAHPVEAPARPQPAPPRLTPPPPRAAAPALHPAAPLLADHHAGMTTLRKVGLASGAAGVVAGALGVFFAVHSKSISDQLDGWSMPGGPAQRSLQSEGENASTRGWIFGGVGAALVFAGAALYVLGAPAAEHGVAIAPTRGGAEVAWGFAF